jgi:hypothetical protein
MKASLVAFALLWALSIAAPRPGQADERTSKGCGLAIFTDFNKQNLELLQSPGAYPIKSVETVLAQRRLQEQYCLKLARCAVGDPNDKSLDLTFRSAFSTCLSEQAKETNE